MVPKKADAKGKKPAKFLDPKVEKKKRELEELERRRRENVIFFAFGHGWPHPDRQVRLHVG